MLRVPFLSGPLILWFFWADLINSTLVLLFLLEDDVALTTLCASCCAPYSFSSYRILCRVFQKDLLALEEWQGFTLWRGMCWSYHRSFLLLWPHFVGKDWTSQDVRLSVLLLASGRENICEIRGKPLEILRKRHHPWYFAAYEGAVQFSCFSCRDQHPVLSSHPLGWHFCLVRAGCGHLVCPGCQKHWSVTWSPLITCFWVIMVMLIFLMKVGSISIKKKLGMVLSKLNIFAGLSLLISKVSASSVWCILSPWLCEEKAGLKSSTGNQQFVPMWFFPSF